jgi:transcriptional regulator with XRE-family HTH domain
MDFLRSVKTCQGGFSENVLVDAYLDLRYRQPQPEIRRPILMLIHIPLGTDMSSTDQEFFKAMGIRISNARKALGLTQQDMADRLGIAQQTYAQYEVGIRRIPASMLPKLAQSIGLTLDELMGVGSGLRSKPGPSSKLELQIEQLRQLPRATQKVVMNMLDGVLAQTSH